MLTVYLPKNKCGKNVTDEYWCVLGHLIEQMIENTSDQKEALISRKVFLGDYN